MRDEVIQNMIGETRTELLQKIADLETKVLVLEYRSGTRTVSYESGTDIPISPTVPLSDGSEAVLDPTSVSRSSIRYARVIRREKEK